MRKIPNKIFKKKENELNLKKNQGGKKVEDVMT